MLKNTSPSAKKPAYSPPEDIRTKPMLISHMPHNIPIIANIIQKYFIFFSH